MSAFCYEVNEYQYSPVANNHPLPPTYLLTGRLISYPRVMNCDK